MVGLDDLDDQLHDGGRREVLAALLHEGGGELAHEVLEDQTVGVALDLQRREQPQQLLQHVVRQPGVALRERSGEIRVRLSDRLHGSVQLCPEIGRAGQREQPREASVLGQEDRAPRLIVCGGGFQAALVFWRQLGVDGLELGLHLAQRDQREHRLGVLVWA